MGRWIRDFSEGRMDQKDLLGGKGARVALEDDHTATAGPPAARVGCIRCAS